MSSNPLQRLINLLPTAYTFIGDITMDDHPNYKVLAVDGVGLVMCSSPTRFNRGQRVLVSDGVIQHTVPAGDVVKIEI